MKMNKKLVCFIFKYCFKIIISLFEFNLKLTKKLPINNKNGIKGPIKLGRTRLVALKTLIIWLGTEYCISIILKTWDIQINPINIKIFIKIYLK